MSSSEETAPAVYAPKNNSQTWLGVLVVLFIIVSLCAIGLGIAACKHGRKHMHKMSGGGFGGGGHYLGHGHGSPMSSISHQMYTPYAPSSVPSFASLGATPAKSMMSTAPPSSAHFSDISSMVSSLGSSPSVATSGPMKWSS